MTEHDLSALDGLLDELDIEEKSAEDPRAAKLVALFEKAKAEYTAKIDFPTWYIHSGANTSQFHPSTFTVPSPDELRRQRKSHKSGSTNQEWTANYLYTHGHFDLCLSYVTSFAISMGVEFPFGQIENAEQHQEYDSSQLALRRSKQERELSKNWGVIKDIIDVGIRSLLTLFRMSSACSIHTWVPQSPTPGSMGYKRGEANFHVLASGFLSFCMREIRVGAGDSRRGYSGMVVPAPDRTVKLMVDMDKVRLQNWTVTHGLALTAGDLALELGLFRTAIEAHTLFLACRGQMWRVLIALANELSSYAQSLRTQGCAPASSLTALEIVAKASVVSALQAIPRPRRLELARLLLIEHRIIPPHWISQALHPNSVDERRFEDEDDLLFNGLLQPLVKNEERGGNWPVLPEEIGVALVKVVFAKKSGLLLIYSKFPTYMREYQQRLVDAADPKRGQEDAGEFDAAEEEVTEGGPRSVRTL